MSRSAVYVYCVVDHRTRPRVPVALRGIPYGGKVRVLPITARRSLVVSSVPLARYGEAALKTKLADLESVSRVALAHARVVEAFLSADAVLPMKLFTMFATDERAVAHMTMTAAELDLLAGRVARRHEWGVRLAMTKVPAAAAKQTAHGAVARARNGADYLLRKKAVKDEAARRTRQAKAVAAELFESLSAHATDARRRAAAELSATGGPLLLDAALLVPRSASARLKAAAARQARALSAQGYSVALTGPWPPYSFMRD